MVIRELTAHAAGMVVVGYFLGLRLGRRRRSERRGIIVVGTLGPSTSASNVIIVAV